MSFTCDQLVCYYCRHFTLINLTNLTFGIYTAIDLNVKVFSVTKSQFNKQSVELSILLTLSKYFTNQKFVFMFDLISSLVEYNEEENIGKKIVCFLLSCKRTIKTPLRQRLMRFLLFDCTVPAVPQTRLNSACGTWDKIEICLRYRNRTLPWTLPPVPQVSLQLYGNQA